MRSRVVAGLACLALAGGCGNDRAYQRDNTRLLASLPVYPGARETEREAAVRTEDEHEAGWTLRAVYALPPGVTVEQVLAFYRDRLAGWTPDEDCCAGLPVAQFHRGDDLVNVNADNVAELVHSYEVGVDARSTTDRGFWR